MSKLFRILRNSALQRSMFVEATGEVKMLRVMSSMANISAAESTSPTLFTKLRPDGNSGVRIFAPYTVYKGKAALSAILKQPKFTKLESGDYRVERSGVVMLTMWPAIGERRYNWEKRMVFALSASEVGTLISLGPKESCDFFHDPSMKSSNEGQVRKTLSIKAHTDGSGYFISLGVANTLLKTNDRLSIPITTGEFAVLRTACSFALPHLLGWDQHSVQLPSYSSPRATLASPGKEWDK